MPFYLSDLKESYEPNVSKVKLVAAFNTLFENGEAICEYFNYNVSDMYARRLDFVKQFGENNYSKLEAIDNIIRQRSKSIAKQQIRGSQDAYDIIKSYYTNWTVEQFYIMSMNRSNSVIKVDKLGTGGISGVLVDMRILFNILIRNNATCFIVVHNHPSGNLRPSTEDRNITKKIVDAGKMMDLKLLDHLIVTESSYTSFTDEGYM